MVSKLDGRVKNLEGKKGETAAPAVQICPAKPVSKPPAKPAPKDEDDDLDLFGSESEVCDVKLK